MSAPDLMANLERSLGCKMLAVFHGGPHDARTEEISGPRQYLETVWCEGPAVVDWGDPANDDRIVELHVYRLDVVDGKIAHYRHHSGPKREGHDGS